MAKKKKESAPPYSSTEGVIFVTRRGKGYVKDERFPKDIEIQARELGTALNGDTVRVEIFSRSGGRTQGSVKEVLSRARTRFVGVLVSEQGEHHLRPDNTKIHVDITLRPKQVKGLEPGTKLFVEMEEWNNPRTNPVGNVLEVIGKAGVHEVEMQSIVFEHGFETAFARRVEEEATQILTRKPITEKDAKRRDMRGITTFTIDPEDAKDFDDALSIQKLQNGHYEIGIHIADVTYYVRPGSIIEEEARKRATSIYLVDRTIPMLPEALSNDICSLVPNEDRRTFSAIFEIDGDAHIKSRWFGETVIHSNKRFTYEEAQKTLNAKEGVLYEELAVLDMLAKKIRERRTKAGAVSFDQDEVGFKLDKKGKPKEIFRKVRQDTNRLIEDFMLLANEEVATFMYNKTTKSSGKDSAFVYRVHEVPDPEKIEELAIFIRAIGYDFATNKGRVTSKDINQLFKKIKGTPEENLIKTATIRSMAKAVYSTKNVGHFGLAFKYYTHFTSPIRRYPDIMVHRIMKNHLRGVNVTDKELSEYRILAIQSSAREVEAVQAERDSIRYKQVEYMLGHIGEEFGAIITGVTEWGIYVEEKNTKSEGLVRISTLADDYFVYEPEKFRVSGERTKKNFALGDEVNVRLISGDLESRTLDFVVV